MHLLHTHTCTHTNPTLSKPRPPPPSHHPPNPIITQLDLLFITYTPNSSISSKLSFNFLSPTHWPTPPTTTTTTTAGERVDMSRPDGSDLRRRSDCSTASDDGQQSTSNDGSVNASKARQRLSLFFSGVGSWRRSESGGTAAARAESSGGKLPVKGDSGGSGMRRGGLDVGQLVRKYMAMVEQLFTSSFSGASRERRGRRELRRRPHSFTSGRDGGGGGGVPPRRRHLGRLSSAPASLRGSPAGSGHLSLGASVSTTMKASSGDSTMDELQSAIQAAIAHCKQGSVAVARHAAAAGGDGRKC